MRPVRRARGEDDGALSGSPPEPGQERARGPTCSLLLACAPARLRSWPEVARRAPAGDPQPPLGVGPGPQSPVSGPGRPGGQEQALPRTVTGMARRFPAPRFHLPVPPNPLWHGHPHTALRCRVRDKGSEGRPRSASGRVPALGAAVSVSCRCCGVSSTRAPGSGPSPPARRTPGTVRVRSGLGGTESQGNCLKFSAAQTWLQWESPGSFWKSPVSWGRCPEICSCGKVPLC